ncbi:histidine--tRNA ligase [Oceanithermus sp.]
MTKAVKGTHDLFDKSLLYHQTIIGRARDWLEAAGGREIATPIFELTEVFERGVGTTTDIVQKEMFTFTDRGGRSLTLRPEGTAGVVRAYLEHGMKVWPQPVKLWYAGPMFRAERPQKGRQRQFHQVGYEVLGSDSPLADAEAVALSYLILRDLGLRKITLRLGSVGDLEDRRRYNAYLREVLKPRAQELSADSQRRLEANPLRILDSKSETDQRILRELAVRPMLDFLGPEAAAHLEQVKSLLSEMNIPYTIDPSIVRGLDYYVRTSWEIHHKLLGAQSALGGGGRYDGLSELLGGPPTPGVGWALGIERVALAMEAEGLSPAPARPLDIYVAALDPDLLPLALQAAIRLWPELRVEYSLSSKRPAKAIREAEKRGARYVAFIGENEARSNTLTLKDISSGEQVTLPIEEVKSWFESGGRA